MLRTELSPLMTIKEVAEYLKVSEATVWRWVKSGKLPSAKIGRTRRVKIEDVIKIIDASRGVSINRQKRREAIEGIKELARQWKKFATGTGHAEEIKRLRKERYEKLRGGK